MTVVPRLLWTIAVLAMLPRVGTAEAELIARDIDPASGAERASTPGMRMLKVVGEQRVQVTVDGDTLVGDEQYRWTVWTHDPDAAEGEQAGETATVVGNASTYVLHVVPPATTPDQQEWRDRLYTVTCHKIAGGFVRACVGQVHVIAQQVPLELIRRDSTIRDQLEAYSAYEVAGVLEAGGLLTHKRIDGFAEKSALEGAASVPAYATVVLSEDRYYGVVTMRAADYGYTVVQRPAADVRISVSALSAQVRVNTLIVDRPSRTVELRPVEEEVPANGIEASIDGVSANLSANVHLGHLADLNVEAGAGVGYLGVAFEPSAQGDLLSVGVRFTVAERYARLGVRLTSQPLKLTAGYTHLMVPGHDDFRQFYIWHPVGDYQTVGVVWQNWGLIETVGALTGVGKANTNSADPSFVYSFRF